MKKENKKVSTKELLEKLKPIPSEKFDLKERLEALRIWQMRSARSQIIVD